MLHPDGQVLIADPDAFEAGYVATTLQARGLPVSGPFTDMTEARIAVEGDESIRAVVIGYGRAPDAPALLEAARNAGVPCLLLLQTAAPTLATLPADIAILVRPFAAFQVAEWVAAALGHPEGGSRTTDEAASTALG